MLSLSSTCFIYYYFFTYKDFILLFHQTPFLTDTNVLALLEVMKPTQNGKWVIFVI